MILRIKDFGESKDFLKFTDFDNFFYVYKDKRQNYVYNLNKSLYLEINDNIVENYQITHNMYWPVVSYKIYGTTHLAWLLMKLNKVDAKNLFNILRPGDVVKYLDKEYVANIIEVIHDERFD